MFSSQPITMHNELQPHSQSIDYKKVRLKGLRHRIYPRYISSIYIQVIILTTLISLVASNRPPRFTIDGQSEIVLRLKESPETKVGTLIYTLKGFDPDNDPLTFGKRNSHDSEIIRIENTGGNEAKVFLAKELDRETQDEYAIVLTLTDSHYTDHNYVTQSFLLLVEDINDNAPTFLPYQNAIEIPEGSAPGVVTTLEATDADEGAYGQVVYYLQELDGDNDVFSIATHQGKGILRLQKELDYERKSLYQLRVLAIDRANQGPVNTGTAAILVKVKDLEDQPPEFVEVQAVARIAEDAPVGTKVLRVRAIDGDRGINNPIAYALEANDLFDINPHTGIVHTLTKLDREEQSDQVNGAHILRISATELSKSNTQMAPTTVRTEVTVIVSDVNDEIPTFGETVYRCEVNENAQTNTPLNFIDEEIQNVVFDHDEGNNGTFRLFLDPPNDLFEIVPELAVNEANFMLRVKNSKSLDFEQFTEVNFTIFAREIDEPSRWSSAHVQIFVRDQNDNFPEFSQTIYNASVLENSEQDTVITHVQAVDVDSGDYGTMGIRYTNLRGGIAHLLNLNPITGVITIKQAGGTAFDREIISRHYLTVEAIDNAGQGNRNTAQIIVDILDVNDNAPTFPQRQYETKLLENQAEFETPLQLEARDADLIGTENSQVTYEIVEGMYRSNFTIDPISGLLRPLHRFDFEELVDRSSRRSDAHAGGSTSIREIDLLVRARDSGIPMLSTVVPVLIYVQDVNDNAPIFQRSFYAKTVPEDLSGGSPVLQVTAIDRDGSSPNNVVVYRIQTGASDKFIINSETGVISVAQGANLDPDLTDSKRSLYTLSVIALDGGLGNSQLMTTCTVNISIQDVNNKPPVLTELPGLKIVENTPVGTLVYRIQATDLDDKAILRYKINAEHCEGRTEEGALVKSSEYDFLGAFEVDPIEGSLKVVKLLDRERVEHIKLAITVEDLAAAKGRQIAEGFQSIQVLDENDNNPKFRLPFYRQSITENSINGAMIVNVLASDVDKNRTITYALEGNPTYRSLMHLDSQTGEIVVASKIDHEQHQWLNFSVRATDSGVPARSSLVDVYITVLDENDNNPYFVGGSKNYTISENAAPGTRVATLQAGDADSGDFGKITFLMDRISSQGKFTIDADTGVLTVADRLDRETKDSYNLVIEAWDNYQFGFLAGESRNAFKQVFISILDENDNPPEVTLPSSCVLITEYHELHERVASIVGKDADDPSTPNGRLDFAITQGNKDGMFELRQVDSWNAQIFASKSLRNRFGNYSLTITTRDLGQPANIMHSTLDICVSDFNDHAPVFVRPLHNTTVRIPENATVGTLILQAYASDADMGQNALVRYRLKPDPLGSYKMFEVNANTGELFLREPLNREKQKIHEIRIEAYDQGLPTSLSSDLDLTIYVRNVNDYEPQFIVNEISLNFTEHADPGSERIKLPDTIDKDQLELDDPNEAPSQVCYFIVNGNEAGYFRLDPETHILTVDRELDREVAANFTLYVRATENCGNDSLSGGGKRRRMGIEINNRLGGYLHNQKIEYDRFKHSRQLRSPESNEYGPEDEEMASYENYDTTQEDQAEALKPDSTVVKVNVRVLDINDNPPRFRSKIFTGGITTNADFGLKFMRVEATDADEGVNGKIGYYQVGEIRQTLSEGLENVRKAPFLLDQETGEVQLNFDPQKGMKGYFDFVVLANDTSGMRDVAHVFIYLLREDQKVRFVFRLQPDELRSRVETFRDTLGNITESIVNIDEIKVHENKDGSVDKTKTDLYMHLVEREDNSIYEVNEVLKLIDSHIESLDGLFKELNVLDTQAAEAQLLTAGPTRGPLFVWLVFTNLFLATLLVVTIALCASQRNGYRRQLRAAKVNIFRGHSSMSLQHAQEPATRVPNTNKHSVQGSNPIWLKGYDNEWFKSEETGSIEGHDSLDDNFLAAATQDMHETLKGTAKLFNNSNDLNRHFNLYNQIDKLTNNAQILARKLETTEL
ncbi:LOW QUALITY PROTEIN: cadherin-23 [Drosophila eugracilis]|uniref:LOW QUALITY PROTEIN: cadherin-23 n=1 Tax=Drosophila eugracilis TaxID=29029 RepID=UPI001BD9C371|nr:LOW QUALITY PROTEIN: cadherin-23 [Drosophila eugracilis]